VVRNPEPAEPLDALSFPADLLAGQREQAEASAEPHALQTRLSWPGEPHPGWPGETERGREHPGRPASPGWDPAHDGRFGELVSRLRELAHFVQWRRHWADVQASGADLAAARMALKRAEDAVAAQAEEAAAPDRQVGERRRQGVAPSPRHDAHTVQTRHRDVVNEEINDPTTASHT
jgi:hypothetical protein